MAKSAPVGRKAGRTEFLVARKNRFVGRGWFQGRVFSRLDARPR